eukprot:2256595-Pleurochrysis_carterae.AAC.1
MAFGDTKRTELLPIRSRSSSQAPADHSFTPYSWRTRGNNELTSLEQRVESRRPRSRADNHRVACGRIRRSIRQERKRKTQGRKA